MEPSKKVRAFLKEIGRIGAFTREGYGTIAPQKTKAAMAGADGEAANEADT